ncbi:hypothetical protein [Streptomyces sp. NPDC058374]|uniref:hypothetical protein n=1 Tax=unclassified Streptomyces TaxID=2593676 RepID=UPI003669F2D9
MSTARHLATMEQLCARPFPDQVPVRSTPEGSAGPGFHLALLESSDAPAVERPALLEEFAALREALAVVLEHRWGPAQHISLWSAFVRAEEARMAGTEEVVEEPWRSLSASVPDILLWRRGSRWIALGTAEREGEQPVRLLALVTAVDPP